MGLFGRKKENKATKDRATEVDKAIMDLTRRNAILKFRTGSILAEVSRVEGALPEFLAEKT